MKPSIQQLAIVSGKGGTGKTSIAASFAKLAKRRIVVDCDVDASNMHIVLPHTIIQEIPFFGEKKAVISQDRCRGCGDCVIYCRFNAIKDFYVVEPVLCEGCAVCAMMCPYEAIDMLDNQSGTVVISQSDGQPFLYANMGIGEGNSGKLVSELREKAKSIAEEENYDLIIIDGPPGIGCPVIASITGTTHVLIVTEPTISGIHDLERIVLLVKHFRIPSSVCINKSDISEENRQLIMDICKKNNIPVIGTIPYDEDVIRAQIAGKTVVEYSDGSASQEITKLWQTVQTMLQATIAK
ncbi:MAG TPA: 4Fe-4S binding protein [Spirochaetota bacterium]|nr:4Fe-4S binding protein [Spirochaetota bacterium]HOM11060.1 4Fe-4S binding protein [Spirochaetota bacterium]HPP50885.1 4Fe-4S binding protein [Spirochaetota bacterium]